MKIYWHRVAVFYIVLVSLALLFDMTGNGSAEIGFLLGCALAFVAHRLWPLFE